MKLSVIIGTFNQKESLKLVLESLFNQSIEKDIYEIIVVDSSSTDGTCQMIKELKPKCQFKYLIVENKGKAYARNVGIKEAIGEIILLTDADMIADKELVKEHILCHENLGNVSVEGLTYNLKRLEDFKNPNNLTPYITRNLKSGKRLPFYYFLSGNLSTKKENLIKAGLFDENFSGYGWEDIELGYRMEKLKIPLIYNKKAINYHYHIVEGEKLLERSLEMGKSAAKFYLKHRNTKIKYFLGMNPLAMSIFYLIKNNKPIYNFIKFKAEKGNRFFYTILKEYNYRDGIITTLKEMGTKV